MAGTEVVELSCDGKWPGCEINVGMIDDKGYLYCIPCGEQRKWHRRCRRLRLHELNRLRRGEPLERY